MSFDTAGDNPPFDLSSDDLLALNFLDAPIGPMTYRRLLELRPEIAAKHPNLADYQAP